MLFGIAALCAGTAAADTTAPVADADDSGDIVNICYNYGCDAHARVEFKPVQIDNIARLFAGVGNAADERRVVGRAVGRMYFYAGEKTPIWHDHGQNYWDDGVRGRMDCIDHSRNTSEFLALLKRRGLLRFHNVDAREKRSLFFFAEHWTARISDIATGAEYAVDSWYFDPGEPAAVMPIADWRHFKDPSG